MDKKVLKANQPVVWKILSRELKEDRLSHAYLFTGAKGAAKRQMALLLAQSVFCPHPDEDGFACTTCQSCQQIASEQSLDFFWLRPGGFRTAEKLRKKDIQAYWKDPQHFELEQKKKEDYRIRKPNILDLQNQFSLSSKGENGHQVYILEQYDQATPEASNALLKFLEEPESGIIGILMADESSRILPTILSRCQILTFAPPSQESLKQEILEKIDDPEAADMLASNGVDADEAIELVQEQSFFTLQQEARNFLDQKASHAVIFHMQREVFAAKGESLNKKAVLIFFQWMLYDLKKEEIELELRASLMEAVLDAMGRLERPLDLALLMDRFYSQMHRSFSKHRLISEKRRS